MANTPLLTSQQRKINKLEARIVQLKCIIHTLTDPDSRILRDLELATIVERIIQIPLIPWSVKNPKSKAIEDENE